ncbi:MAG: DUF2786 domain-containing protein [Desulfoprunum sp.]|nr:DUF2786 domain-containing protein [Desulfoprunum sp.]
MSRQESQNFYSAWARQLQREFVDICYQYSLKLLPPIMEITDSTRSLGNWQAVNRTIGISRHLILEYSWDITINVLKHEMAHQICSEMFESHGMPHDRDFLRACDLVGLPVDYCRAAIDFSTFLPQHSAGNQGTGRRKNLLEKIRKLLAMADSANEHEALVALQMAGRIMEKYNLDGAAGGETEEITYRIIKTGKKRIDGYQRTIASILSRYFKVTLIYSRLYDPVADEVYKTFEIFGRSDHVEVAEHCFCFLQNRLAYLWQTNRTSFPDCGRSARKSYYLGVLHGFSENFQKKDQPGEEIVQAKKPCRTPALSVHHLSSENDALVQGCIRRRYPRLRTLKSSSQNVSPQVYHQGRAAGKDIVLSKVLQQEKDQEKTKFLT